VEVEDVEVVVRSFVAFNIAAAKLGTKNPKAWKTIVPKVEFLCSRDRVPGRTANEVLLQIQRLTYLKSQKLIRKYTSKVRIKL
jgi:hypothetical protein